jgi:hypothetical protein
MDGEEDSVVDLVLLTARMQSVIRRLPNSLSHEEESMARHGGANGVY